MRWPAEFQAISAGSQMFSLPGTTLGDTSRGYLARQLMLGRPLPTAVSRLNRDPSAARLRPNWPPAGRNTNLSTGKPSACQCGNANPKQIRFRTKLPLGAPHKGPTNPCGSYQVRVRPCPLWPKGLISSQRPKRCQPSLQLRRPASSAYLSDRKQVLPLQPANPRTQILERRRIGPSRGRPPLKHVPTKANHPDRQWRKRAVRPPGMPPAAASGFAVESKHVVCRM